MKRRPGRDQREPMERLVRLASALHHAGARGVPVTNLLEICGWADAADGTTALGHDIRNLRRHGWQIDNIAGAGLTGIYRMTTVDNRLRLKLDAEQQAALRRAVLVANRDDLADRLGLDGAGRLVEVGAAVAASGAPAALSAVLAAVRRRALLQFRYGGVDRIVHPAWARTQSTQWYLHGCEKGSNVVKAFVIARMLDVTCGEPGSARHIDVPRHARLHPMSWEIDPPVDVVLRTSTELAPDVERWLEAPLEKVEEDGVVEMRYRVTNRAALRARIYQLGTRVTVVEPDEVRKEILDELAQMAGE